MSSKIFKWNQPSGKVWTIETNIEGKYIKTTDENGNVIQEQTNLSEGTINFMTENLISVLTTQKMPKIEYNPMYA